MRLHPLASLFLTLALSALPGAAVQAQGKEAAAQRSIVLASTTSTDHSGLYDILLPSFTRDTGIAVRVIAVGTGRALSIARHGDADVLVVHDEASEIEFVRAGHGVERRTFMYNDYVLVGPVVAVADISSTAGVADAFRRIAHSNARFVSRGDDSGTHKKELSLWGMALGAAPSADWYLEVGRGMGAALNMANELDAYTLSDRSTWVSFNNRANLRVVLENKPPLTNPYSVILTNPERHPSVRFREAQIFADWLTSEQGLSLIRNFRVRGQQLFFTW